MEKLEFEEFAPLFGSWAETFKPFIESKEMFDIYAKIKEDAKTTKIVPAYDDTFKSFAQSQLSQIKSVWYLMDPYSRTYKTGALQATGIPMDCSNSPDGKLQPSLEKFYDAIDKSLGRKVERNKSLSYLLSQGVLLLNSDLTCRINRTSSHEGLWEPFQKFFLEEIMSKKTGIIYVLSGKSSYRMEKFINPLGNYIFKIEHPAAAEHGRRDWNYEDIFNKTNKILESNSELPIVWDPKEWEDTVIDECPF